MIYTDILNNEFARSFESEIIKFLESLVVEGQEEFEYEPLFKIGHSGYEGKGDIYFPKGLSALDVKDPLMIEIKGSLLLSTYSREIKKAKDYIKSNKNSQYWVIYSHSKLNIPEWEDNNKIRFIKLEKLKEIAKHTNSHNKEISQDSVWQPERQDVLIKRAAKCLKDTKCSFILGAGVSVDAGSPSWDELLKQIMDGVAGHYPLTGTDYSNINSRCGWSALITARYVVDGYFKDDDLIQKMRSIIYKNKKCNYNNSPTAIPLIAEITKVCNVESLLTFNYDEFVEEALDKIGVKYVPVYGKGAIADDEKPIYHIHGYISRYKGRIDSYPVLSEREYHRLYSDDFHWSNVELLHALTRNTCFLVGLSMSDPNLRRLLDIARYDDSGRARHFIFMRKEPLDISHPDTAKDQKHWNNVERQFEQLGLNIIWFDYNPADKSDFTDLAVKLKGILTQANAIIV